MKTVDEPTPSKVARSIPSADAAEIPHNPPTYQQPTYTEVRSISPVTALGMGV